MALPTTVEELRAFVVAAIEEQQAATTPTPAQQPNTPDLPALELWRARDAVARAEGVVELLRQSEQTMAESEEEMKTQVGSLREELRQDVLKVQTQFQELTEKISAELTRQDEATEELVSVAPKQIVTEQAKAQLQSTRDITNKIIEHCYNQLNQLI